MPRNRHEDRPCSTGCGQTVPVVVGDTPRGPLLCDACRPAGRPSVRAVCDRDGCSETVRKITGVQRRRWELGRPVYCSPACRTAALSWVESCGHCRTAMVVNRNRTGTSEVLYCSRGCLAAATRLPPRACAHCGGLFDGPREDRRFCSRACAARSRSRRSTVVRTCPGCGRRDVVSADTARKQPRCSKACGAAWPTSRRH